MATKGETPRRSRRQERKEETRAELIEAAARVFARHGFHGASLAQVAEEAGYTTGAIYWHFSGKDDLFLAVYEEYTTSRVHDFDDIHEHASGTSGQRARVFGDQWMARLRDNPEFTVLALEFGIHAWRNPDLREAFANRVAAGRLALARIIEEEASRARIKLPMAAEDLATVLRETGSGLGSAKLLDESIPDALFGDFLESYFDMLFARPQRATRRARRT